MRAKEILEKYGLSQQELADFTHIPRSRIQKWVDADSEPPKVADLNIVLTADKFLSTIDINDVKKAIKNYHIIALNVEPTPAFQKLIIANQSTNTQDPPSSYGKKNEPKDNNDAKKELSSLLTNTDEAMINRILGIIEHSNANMSKIAEALDKTADSNVSLAATIERLVAGNKDDEYPKDKAS